CPGCYPTSVLLPCLPLLKAGLVEATGIKAFSMSGVTGAGRKVAAPYLFPECNESLRPYAVTGHRHLPEIEQELALAAGVKELNINFLPHLVPVNRGIHSTILMQAKSEKAGNEALACLQQAYQNEPFVRVLNKGELADTKNITMTNYCEIGCCYDQHTGNVILSSAIDNLTKGAAGQALQNLNIMAGWPEDSGLR
ncbi:MAG: N-acetyl-gamma-glutamyl-phosphate reductase, partial [Oligosphaeraceae bacterium]|nr:N-acetyl-gamma-glutamyl-phosphate reductase [Oligosphaeraceae bacterium]